MTLNIGNRVARTPRHYRCIACILSRRAHVSGGCSCVRLMRAASCMRARTRPPYFGFLPFGAPAYGIRIRPARTTNWIFSAARGRAVKGPESNKSCSLAVGVFYAAKLSRRNSKSRASAIWRNTEPARWPSSRSGDLRSGCRPLEITDICRTARREKEKAEDAKQPPPRTRCETPSSGSARWRRRIRAGARS